MRSTEFLPRSLTLAAMCAALAGCASLDSALQAVKDKVAPSVPEASSPLGLNDVKSAAAASPNPAASAASAPSVVAPTAPSGLAGAKAAVVDAPAPPTVSATTQRAFDDALRAMRAGRTADAERALKALAASNPELGGVHANLGLIYRQSGKTAPAVLELEKAVAASPRQALFFNQLGIAYREQGQFAKSRDAYERAIALDSGYAAPLLNLGILHDLYLWDGKRALELYDRYLALSPAGDTTVVKWVADLKNRKAPPPTSLLARKEKD
ncbi:MAG: tetratricopeptide repeat protein [Burkholderiaceae bacterium]